MIAVVALCAAHMVATTQGLPRSGQLDEWETAAKEIKRLPPSAFKRLPVRYRSRLKDLGCTIPQVPSIAKHHNVVAGEFAKAGQTDWAVLCSRMGKSSVLVFWGGADECPSELAPGDDKLVLQGMSEGRIEYSRMISPVAPKSILEYQKAYGGPKPPPLSHQGIEDAFVGKASVVYYCYQGSWVRLQGAD
ncbi:MAG: hypothetical protein ACE145_19210 [Terriglobia bacterium]